MAAKLINFLRDRYNDEQADALKRTGVFPSPVVHGNGHVSLHVYPTGTAVSLRGPGPDGYDDLAALTTWADSAGGWTQARVLAEVDAKRRILALHSDATGHSCSITDETGYELNYAEVAGDEPCTTLRLLALPYANHPDYRKEWKP